jgi:AAA family ATP:ADP antiporter
VSINLVEGVWKKAIGIAYPDPRDLGAIMGSIQIYTGFAVVFSMLCGAHLLRIVSWRTAALLTPIVILLTGSFFFVFFIFRDNLGFYIAALGTSAVMLSAYFGALQNILSKATKYAFFDSTKEIAYIPLDDELKVKGKAAADVIGGRLGKSGGAFVQWAMISFIPGASLVTLAPNIAVIFVVMMVMWIGGVFALAREFEDRIK